MASLFPPGPRGRYPFHLVREVHRDFLGFASKNAASFGDIFGFSLAGRKLVFINHPDLIRDVLVTHQRQFAKGRALERARSVLGTGLLTSEGEFHLRQRRLVQPAFHRDRIARYAPAMVDITKEHERRWHDGLTIDAHASMMDLTLSIVAKTLFDANLEAETDEIREALNELVASFDFAILPLAEVIEKLPLPWVRRFKRARDRLDRTVYRLIREHRASGEDRGDLLSMLLSETDTEGDGTGMTDVQLRDEIMTLFLAGHETTANALTWTWYLLCRNPKVEERLHAEVDALGHLPGHEDLPRLEFTRRIITESMRLYPPAYALGRRALQPYSIGGYELPARTVILMSQYLVHRDPRWFPRPDQFDPDRWLPERVAERPKFSYFPFGAGTRICIGEQFAWTEAVLVLATLAQRWRLWIAPKQRIAIDPKITLRPRYGVQMVVRSR